jgi:hypothetical protein
VGGDKGGSSFKMSFQICNVLSPNAVNNTYVFCVFQAADTPVNLTIALERYCEQINELHLDTGARDFVYSTLVITSTSQSSTGFLIQAAIAACFARPRWRVSKRLHRTSLSHLSNGHWQHSNVTTTASRVVEEVLKTQSVLTML